MYRGCIVILMLMRKRAVSTFLYLINFCYIHIYLFIYLRFSSDGKYDLLLPFALSLVALVVITECGGARIAKKT